MKRAGFSHIDASSHVKKVCKCLLAIGAQLLIPRRVKVLPIKWVSGGQTVGDTEVWKCSGVISREGH